MSLDTLEYRDTVPGIIDSQRGSVQYKDTFLMSKLNYVLKYVPETGEFEQVYRTRVTRDRPMMALVPNYLTRCSA